MKLDLWTNRLTSEQRETFARDGYLVVPEALSAQLIERLLGAINEQTKNSDSYHNVADILARHPAFLDLVDVETVRKANKGPVGAWRAERRWGFGGRLRRRRPVPGRWGREPGRPWNPGR
jgi:hypothetical protein